MISNYLTFNNTFDEIVDNDPVNECWGNYWYLNTHQYEPYCWNTEVFTTKEIQDILVLGRRINQERAQTSGSGENCLEHRRSFVSWINPNKTSSWIYERLTNLITQTNETYFKYDLSHIERLQFTYYNSEENGCYKPHIDPMNWNLPHNRKLSLVVQLSSPHEYEGGELKLYTGHEPHVIKKELGLVISFPSYTLHEVTPVTKGERYSLVAWVHGPAFK